MRGKRVLGFVVVSLAWIGANLTGQVAVAWTPTNPQVNVARFGGSGDDLAGTSVTDSAGNIYVAGAFTGTVDFDPGVGTESISAAASGYDLFVVKLTMAGNLAWVRTIGTNWYNLTEYDWRPSIDVGVGGSVVVAGAFRGTVDFDPGQGTSTMTATGGSNQFDAFVLKLNSNGAYEWAVQTSGDGLQIGRDVALSSGGDVYVSGGTTGTVDFDPSAGNSSFTSVGDAVFLWKLSSTGNLLWARGFALGSYDYSYGLDVDTNDAVYMSGIFRDTEDFDPGVGEYFLVPRSIDVFVVKLSSAGSFEWARHVGGGSYDYGESVTVDAAGNVAIVGRFSSTTDLDLDPGSGTVGSPFRSGIFIVTLTASGSLRWARTLGPSSGMAEGVEFAADGSLLVAGSFNGTVDFDPGAGTVNAASSGLEDAFVLRLDSGGDFSSLVTAGGAGRDYAYDVVADGTDSAYVTGAFEQTAEFTDGATIVSAGAKDAFLWKVSLSSANDPTSNVSPPTNDTALISPPTPTSTVPSTPTTAAPNRVIRLPNGAIVRPTTTAQRGKTLSGRTLLSPSSGAAVTRLVSGTGSVCKVMGTSLKMLKAGTCRYKAYVIRKRVVSSINVSLRVS